ncbi:hypothetical protein HY605_00530 [Candidatus Peregrinibacteria bacterium]|nr:hypothetical protein [Candidatus Peregrinibacteria bacterium]
MPNPEEIIKNKRKIFTHCYSTSVINLLIGAKKKGAKFEVFCTETRPKLLGRRTAKALAIAKIPVTIIPDLAGTQVLKDCDLFLFGIEKEIKNQKGQTEKILNKTGTINFIETARKEKIPYFDITRLDIKSTRPLSRKTTKEQLWKNPPSGIKVLNPGYEEIPAGLVKIVEL